MSEERGGCNDLTERLWQVIENAIKEWDMCYAEVIGCLEIIKFDLINDAPTEEDEDDNS